MASLKCVHTRLDENGLDERDETIQINEAAYDRARQSNRATE